MTTDNDNFGCGRRPRWDTNHEHNRGVPRQKYPSHRAIAVEARCLGRSLDSRYQWSRGSVKSLLISIMGIQSRHLIHPDAVRPKAANGFAVDHGSKATANEMDRKGRKDPRHSKSELREEYKKSDYFSSVLDDSVNFLDKYAHNLAVICHGNHETGVIKNFEIDLTKQLTTRLNDRTGSQIIQGEYEEFVRLSFLPPKVGNKQLKHSKCFFLNHGWGGASPVTGGMIHHHRTAEFIKGADFICMGHLHTAQIDERVSWEVSNKNNVLEKRMHFLRTPGYKIARKPGTTSWETVKGINPKPRGGVWIRFFYNTAYQCLDGEIIKRI